MKKTIQIVLFIFLILIAILFYRTYLATDNQVINSVNENEDKTSLDVKNNLIKNLKYEVLFDENKQYLITADLSELKYTDGIEIVNMQKVTAIFIDKNNVPLTITADKAVYNNSTYDTFFDQNVKVEYLYHSMYSDKLDLIFKENLITVYENVKYEGQEGIIKADNVILNLITKNIQIYMEDKKRKVEVIKN